MLTVVSSILVVVLICSELGVYTTVETVNHIAIDKVNRRPAKITLSATFFHLSCDDVHLDLEATKGNEGSLTDSEVEKTPAGVEGCSIKGVLEVPKVGGNFHFATGTLGGGKAGSFITLRNGVFMLGGPSSGANLSHTIHHLSFGDDFPGLLNPLEEVTNIVPTDVGQYQFHIKVIPTMYKPLRRRHILSNQYSISEQFVRLDLLSAMQGGNQPGIYFYYDFFPVIMEYRERKPSFLNFLTRVCGIIGGIFTVAGVIDGILHRASESVKKKH